MKKHPFEIKTSGGNYFQTSPKKMNYKGYSNALKKKYKSINGGYSNALKKKKEI